MKKHFKPIVLFILCVHALVIMKIRPKKPTTKAKIQVQTVHLQPAPPKVTPIKQKVAEQKPARQTIKKKIPVKKAPSRPKSQVAATKKKVASSKKPTAPAQPYNKNWQQDLVQTFYDELDFPEFGQVKARLEILGNGKVKSVEIINSENEENERYLLQMLMKMNLPKWSLNSNDKQSVVITFASEVSSS